MRGTRRRVGPKRTRWHLGGAIDDVVRRAEKLPDQFRFVFIERPLQVRSQKTVLDVHSRRQAQFRHAPQNQRLVGGLLRILAEHDDPAGVECAVDVIVPAVHVKRVLGQRPRDDLQNHRRTLAGRVVVLLHTVHNSLAGGKIDDPLPTH